MALTNHIVPDSPTNNFATLNPLKQQWNATRVLKEGNLLNYRVTHSSSTATLILTGKQYWEVYSTYGNQNLGVIDDNATQSNVTNSYDASSARGIYNLYGAGYVNGSGVVTTGGPIAGYTTPSVIMFAVDIDAGKMWVGKDGVWNGDPDAGTNPFWTNLTSGLAWTPWVHAASTTQANDAYFNFGQDPTFGGAKSPTTTYTDANGIGAFYYQPPTGALALCTVNLSDFTPTVTGDTPQDYFKAVTYDGDSTNNHSISTVGFQPDLIWIKIKTSAGQHVLIDSVRGDDRELFSSNTNAEQNPSTTGHVPALRSINSTGFTLSANINPTGDTNSSSNTFVAWCWKAGGAPTTDNTATSGAMNANGSAATSSNSSVSLNGTLQSNYTPAGSPTIYPKRMSINTDAGFSIVKYASTGTANSTVPHGLSQKPELVIIKNLDDSTASWLVVGDNITYYMNLNATNADPSSTSYSWVPLRDSNIFKIGSTRIEMNSNGDNYIAYCWHSVEGYSKFGSYTGNGSPDGPFVYCGFRPAWVMIKKTDGAATWWIVDSSRDEYNPTKKYLQAESANAESAGSSDYVTADFVSNGFKIRNTSVSFNSGNHIFMAFSEQPFKFSNAR